MKPKTSLIQTLLLLATAFVIVFVGYAVYQFASDETDMQTEKPERSEETSTDAENRPIESPEDLDEALEELESLDPDEVIDVESDIDEELSFSS